jgi:hypothetical protein
MNEVSIKTRARIIEKLGRAINFQYGANVTDELVAELLSLLDKG